MSRLAAFGIHLGISFLILLVLGALVVFIWYPGIFFETDGGWRGLRIIAAVDMVLGPALTLVVYKVGKPGLKKDLAMIGIFQFLCLFAGTYLVYSERPIAAVFSEGRFYVTNSDDYLSDAGTQIPDLTAMAGPSPKWVSVKLPSDQAMEAAIRSQYIQQNRILASAAELYAPFDAQDPEFQQLAVEIEKLLTKPNADCAIEHWLSEHGGELKDYAFYPFASRFVYRYIGFSRQSWQSLGLLELDVLEKPAAQE